MSNWAESEVQSTFQKIIKRSAKDAAFRKLALSDSNKAISEVAGKAPPLGFKVRFVELQGASMVIALPDAVTSRELSDAELEEVAGGGRCGASCAASCVVSAVE